MDTGSSELEDRKAETFKSANEVICECGEKDINHISVYKTAISVVFILGKRADTIPIREEIQALLTQLQTINATTTMHETKGTQSWKMASKIPVEKKFEDSFV
eukprot:7731041-Ditylum_brightwellii.AAC.1